MHTIETTAVIPQDRRLMLQLPPDVEPGEHRVVVLLDEPEKSAERQDGGETPTRWEDGVLVYDGDVAGSIDSVIDDLREERMGYILAGYRP